jgi:Ca2+-binding RTX toxin-like protein
MAYTIFATSSVTSGTTVDLGTTDSLFVAEGVTLGSTGLTAVLASGSSQIINIQGSVTGATGAILLGNSGTRISNDQIEIGESGYVYAPIGGAISFAADGTTLVNHGTIEGADGIYGFSATVNSDGSANTIVNDGVIRVSQAAIIAGAEKFITVNNSGLIEGGYYSINGVYQVGAIKVHNGGKMIGDIGFGMKNDLYDGHTGSIKGHVTGNDGNDTFIGGKGAEFFEGDAGRDTMTGGDGADHFIFRATSDSTVAKSGRDLIIDFSHKQHDRIDLLEIDAIGSKSGDQAFDFVGNSAFDGGKGELRYEFDGSHTLIMGDLNGDKHADFEIELAHKIHLDRGDFIL